MKCHNKKGYLINIINHLTHIIYSRVHINFSHYFNVCLFTLHTMVTYSIVINIVISIVGEEGCCEYGVGGVVSRSIITMKHI